MKYGLVFLLLFCVTISCTINNEVTLGFIGTLSGRYSEVGVSSRNGAELAVEIMNKSGGINGKTLSLVSLDDQNNSDVLQSAFESHIAAGRKLIVGPNLSSLMDVIEDFAKQDDLLILSPTVSTDKLSNKKDSFFRVISGTGIEGSALAKKAKKMGYIRAAVIYDISNSQYTEPIYLKFKEVFEKTGKIVYVNHISNQIKEDYLDIAKSITATNADLLVLITTAIDAAFIGQQVRKFDNNIQFFAARWAKTQDIISQGGKAVEGMILSSMYTTTPRSDAYLLFEKNFVDKYNTKPSFVSAYAYESVMLLANAMKETKSTDPVQLKSFILSQNQLEGLEEKFTINAYGDVVRKTSLATIKNGAFEVLDD